MKSKKFILLSGLPGSGKSTWAKNHIGQKTSILDFDIWKDTEPVVAISEMSIWSWDDVFILDGLFLTDEDRARVLNALYKKVKKSCDGVIGDVEVEVHEWNENREACIRNDENRRSQSSKTTIRMAKFEPTDLTRLNQFLNFECTLSIDYSDVREYSTREQVEASGQSGVLKSESWCGGGTWGNCWGQTGTVGAEPPVEFTQLDDLLSKFCPNITFLQYKRILSHCVETEEYYEHDYYGGSTSNYRYVCDLKKLGEFIEENNMI